MKKEIHFCIAFFLIVLVGYQQMYAQDFTEEQEKMLTLINELRAEKGLQPLRLNPHLNTAAQVHSEDQAINNFLGHIGSDGSSFAQRVRRTDYEGSPQAENVAAGNATVEATFRQWKNSSDHLANMLRETSNEFGVGHGINPAAKYTHYWTQVFGRGSHTLSVGDVSNPAKDAASIFPNPVDHVFSVNFRSEFQKPKAVYLTTLRGRILKEMNINTTEQSIQIEIADLPSGIYMLKTEKNEIYKIVKS